MMDKDQFRCYNKIWSSHPVKAQDAWLHWSSCCPSTTGEAQRQSTMESSPCLLPSLPGNSQVELPHSLQGVQGLFESLWQIWKILPICLFHSYNLKWGWSTSLKWCIRLIIHITHFNCCIFRDSTSETT